MQRRLFMKHNTEFIQNLMVKLSFPQNAIDEFTRVLNRLDSEPDFAKAFDTAYQSYMFPTAGQLNMALAAISRAAKKFGENEYTMHFVFILSCTEELRERYLRLGIDEQIFWDSVDDLRCKLIECIDCEEVPGTFVAGWNDGFFRMTRFALGRFQFEKTDFTEPGGFVTKSGCKIEENSTVINFHIPSSGIPLTDEVRLDAYKKAYEFFKDGFDGPVIFCCGSWLLYPEHRKFLPENSNILRFMDDFELVSWKDEENFHNGWRIFGKDSDLPVEQLPERTALQRAYKKWFLDGGKGGSGFGVIVFDGEKIVR